MKVFDAGTVLPNFVQVVDLDANGRVEILYSAGNQLFVLDHGLRPLLSWQRPGGSSGRINAVFAADLTGDGAQEIVVASGDSRANCRVDVLEPALP